MTVTVASFRESFPEFTDPGIYDGGQISMYIALAAAFQNPQRWDPLTIDYGTDLFVAHHLVLQVRAEQTADAGGIPGTVQGVLTSKSVDKAAASYDINSVTLDQQAAFWNMTTYGIRFLQLTRAYGAGGVQVGAGPAGFDWCF